MSLTIKVFLSLLFLFYLLWGGILSLFDNLYVGRILKVKREIGDAWGRKIKEAQWCLSEANKTKTVDHEVWASILKEEELYERHAKRLNDFFDKRYLNYCETTIIDVLADIIKAPFCFKYFSIFINQIKKQRENLFESLFE